MELDLEIKQGATFTHVVRWETSPYVYKAITGITKAAPAVVTATGHGVPDGWKVAVVSAGGMSEINASRVPPRSRDYHKATVLTSDTLALNDVDSTMYSTYTSGGFLAYRTPQSLSGYTARMTIKDKVGGTQLFRLDTSNGRISVNDTQKTITLLVTAIDTAAITTWRNGVYDLELVAGDGTVTRLMDGSVCVSPEVTTT